MLKYKYRSILFFTLVLGMSLAGFESLAQAHASKPSVTYRIKGDYPVQPLPPPTWIIEEGKEALTIDDVILGNWKDASWIDLTKNKSQKSKGSGSYWFRINISSDIEIENWKILIERYNPSSWYDVDQAITHLHAHYFQGNNKIGEGFSGREMPTSKRDLKDFYYQSILVLDLAAGETVDIWIKYEGPMGYISPIVQLHPADFQLMPVPWPYKLTTYNFYLGFLCTLLIIGFFLLIWFKGPVYLWFLGFVVLNIITITYWRNTTTLVQFLFPNNSVHYQQFGFILDMTKWGILVLFGRVFIQTKQYYPILDKLLLVAAIGFISLFPVVIVSGSRLTMGEQSVFVLAFFGLIVLTIFSVFGYFIFSKNSLARFFSIGAIIPFIGILMIGSFRENLWIRNFSELLMSLGPMITLILAIVFRFRQEALGRIQAEEEKTSLLENQTIQLEKQVKERTLELSESLENLRSTQDQLIQQEKLASLGQLTAGIAHEIKNPLNFVNNFSEVSIEMIEEIMEARGEKREKRTKNQEPRTKNEENEREELEDEILEDIKSNLKKIHEHGSRANGIVTSMLQHSRGGTGKKEPTDLNALIKEYSNLAFHAFLSGRHGMLAGKTPINVAIDLQLDEQIRNVPLVSEDFSRVLLNLCNNAFDAMRLTAEIRPPKLTIRTKLQSEKILIEVEDNGAGIPDEIKDKILQPFFTTKKGTEGTGLGLSITHDIVKAHGGHIKIESKENEGSKFSILLDV